MDQIKESPFFILAVAALAVTALMVLLARLRRARRERDASHRADYARRLLTPDLIAFAAHYGYEPSPALRRLYGDRQGILDGDFEVILPGTRRPWPVSGFEPMEDGTWVDIEGHYAFASDGYGNQYNVRVQDEDPEVLFHDHESGENVALGVSLSKFLAAERKR